MAFDAFRFPERYADRREAGQRLAQALRHYRAEAGAEPPLVLGLPRGGVPVAYEVARELNAPLDVLLVRKLRSPGYPELGMGAIVDGQPPQRVLNADIMSMVQPSPQYLEAEVAEQLKLIAERRKSYYAGHEPLPVRGRTVIVVDDGIATGGTVRAALKGLRAAGASRVVLAVPVAPAETVAELQGEADEVICPWPAHDFHAVGQYYRHFDQTSDEEVVELLAAARGAKPEPSA